MKLELMGDKKIKRTRDEDREEGVFRFRETPSMFILSAHLQGYKRNSIEIIIIKEEGGDQTPRDEEKLIQKLVIMGKVMSKNDEEILGFRKVFKIPNGVVASDQINAEYSEEECVLKICMPKFVRQICGVQIEEIKEEEEEEKFGESSHKILKQFKVDLIENPNNRVLEIRGEDGESDDEREEDGKEETEVEVKNSSEALEQNVGEESQEVISNNNGALGGEVDEEVIEGIKETEIEEPIEIAEPKYKIIEDRDVDVKGGTGESSLQMKITSNTLVERVAEEKGQMFYNNESGNQESQDSDVKLMMRSSQLESPLGTHDNNHEVIGKRESHGGHEIEVEVDEHEDEVPREISQELDGLKDIEVEASEEEKSNEQEDDELEDIQVEARDQKDIIKAKEQRDDEVYMKISQEVEERRESQFKENEERKKFHRPLFIAGSAFVVSLIVFFVRHTRVQKR